MTHPTAPPSPNPPGETLALYGGSFNPPHIAHVLAVSYCLSVLPVDRVWVCPAYHHALGKSLIDLPTRMDPCRLACAPFGDRVLVSDIEQQAQSGGRTIRTVEYLLAQDPTRTIYLILGADILGELHRWLDVERLWSLTKPIILGRSGCPHNDDPRVWGITLPSVSSSALRPWLASAQWDRCAPLLPAAVLNAIRDRHIYI
jgi:nicotinate-nucleotide adenylyltransferase